MDSQNKEQQSNHQDAEEQQQQQQQTNGDEQQQGKQLQQQQNSNEGGGGGEKQQATAGIPGKDDERKLFVGGLTRNTTENELREYFGKFGEIESVSIKMDPYTGVSRGFAFMVFQNAKSIDKLLTAGDHFINKRKVIDIRIILAILWYKRLFLKLHGTNRC